VVRVRERLILEDGDEIDLDWGPERSGPLALLVHGLTGSSSSLYIMGVQRQLQRLGWRTVAMNLRGASTARPNRRARAYHSGETGDLAAIVERIWRRAPDTPLAIVGYSLGGNMLLKWLGETQLDDPRLIAAVAVSVPFRLERCIDAFEQGFSQVYGKRFVRDLSLMYHENLAYLETVGAHDEAARLRACGKPRGLRTLRQFDDRYTAPLHGFIDSNDYYQQSSSAPFLQHIKRPTLIVHAIHDPFVPLDAIPNVDDLSPNVTLELSERGGHLGFITGRVPAQPVWWLEERIPAHLQSALSAWRQAHNGTHTPETS